MTENYLTLTPGHKLQILSDHLQELEGEHYLLGVMGEEALEADRPGAVDRLASKRAELDSAMSVVRRRMDEITGTPPDDEEKVE